MNDITMLGDLVSLQTSGALDKNRRMAKVFLTGASGFVGGEALYSLYNATAIRPTISVLNRDAEKGILIEKAFPGVRIVQGDLDAVDIIEEEARQADVVFHLASTKHAASCSAIARGLSKRSTPGYWIQMSGASMFSVPDIEQGTYGEPRPEIYNDVSDVEKILSVIEKNPARVVDHLVLAQDPTKIKTALVVGPLIYGIGQGPVNQRSIQIPEMARITIKIGQGFQVGKGKSVWSNVHVRDLGLFFRSLLEAAVSEKAGCWNKEGVYTVENGRLAFGELGEAVAKEAHKQGLIESPEVSKVMDPDEANAAMPGGAIFWGSTAVGVSDRAKTRLGWSPVHTTPLVTVEEAVRLEAGR